MKILILGGTGMLGPWVVKALKNKHQLLLEVSHELRSPLARMQLLLAMIPDHKNIEKLKSILRKYFFFN